ncbi:hypothetical protein KY290_013673 [Solanum tuberosum]|uniref:Uncharacterized protein n=1 Tax=Solanum tuberosum TaxID=4113 RepID=A0ABQ7VMC8_SOLTU|nr:hypothetical protein KY290_013673 [Solanum tuberosum]
MKTILYWQRWKLRSRLHQVSGKPTTASVKGSYAMATPIRVTRAVQHDLDAALLTRSTKKTLGKKQKELHPRNILVSKSVKKSKYTNDSDGDMVVSAETHKAQGWATLFLQGNRRRNMGRKETREFYTNVIGTASSISSTDGVTTSSALSLLWKDYHQLLRYRVDLHMIICLMVHKTLLPRSQKCTKANYFDLTLMELLISKVQINLPTLVLSHIHRICVHDDKDHGLGYGFWLGEVFVYFRVPVKEWQEQTTKDVLGEVHHVVIPATSRGANAPVQRLKALLTTKNEEIDALRVGHSAAMDQLHISYGLEHAGLVEENSRLKDKLAKTQAALDTERSSNSAHLKNLVDLLAKGSPSSSSFVPPFV